MWEINIGNQTLSFLLSMCLGCLMCVLYDIIRAVRKVCLNSFWAVLFTDVFLWVFYAVITFIFLMSRTNGEIRGYILLGELLGFVAFRISLSRLIFPIMSFAIIKTSAISKKVRNMINNIYVRIEALIFEIWQQVCKKIKMAVKTAKKLLKNGHKLLYTNKNNTNAENSFDETKTKA